MDHSTHLTRGKKPDDQLEQILEPWGLYRQKGVPGLSSPRKSPLEGYNCLETAGTREIDRKKLGFFKTINAKTALFEYKIWKARILSLGVPRETTVTKPVIPAYDGDKRYSKIDRILSQIHSQYYNILIHKYEHQWEIRDFEINWGLDPKVARNQLRRARKAAKEILRKNGYRA